MADTPSSRHSGTAYVVTPTAEAGPGVLVLHSWWGLTSFIKQWCDRLADEGYVVMAPDLYGGEVASTPDEAEELLAEMDVNAAADLALNSVGALLRLPVTQGNHIAVVGFSMGASLALWLSARANEFVSATVAYYGTQQIALDDAKSAFLGHFAEHDELVDADEVVELEAHLRLLDKDVTFHHYAGTGHWFVEEDRPAAFDAAAAQISWQRTVEFLNRNLLESP
ncbi:MAG: dienelactone hydrolase family protein [Acidimicrobiia bacterium]